MAEEIESSGEVQWQRDARGFALQLLWNWHTWLGTFGGLGVIYVFSMVKVDMPLWAVPWIMVLGLVWGGFDAWRNEYKAKNLAVHQLRVFQDEYAYALAITNYQAEFRNQLDEADRATIKHRWFRIRITLTNKIAYPLFYSVVSLVVDGKNQNDFTVGSAGIGSHGDTLFLTKLVELKGSQEMPTKVECEVALTIRYGAPEGPPIRELKKRVIVEVFTLGDGLVGWLDIEHSDIRIV